MKSDPKSDSASRAAPAEAGAPSASYPFAGFLHRDHGELSPGAPYSPALYPTSIYALPGEPSGEFQYARWANPGWSALERALGYLDDARAVIFPSGAAAVTALLASQLKAGDRVLLQSDAYMGTRSAAEKFFAKMGVEVRTCPTRRILDQDFGGVRLVLLETPSNPGLDIVDIGACAERVHAAEGVLAIDNTLMTPLGQRPLDLGADAVVYSGTKVLGGHSDVLFGHVASRSDLLAGAIAEWRRVCGAIPGPFEAWQMQRSLETLELRLSRMHENALALARALEGHRAVRSLAYPGLAAHPGHPVALRQMRGFGALIGLTLADRDSAERFIDSCGCLRATTSFGGLHSSAERRARWGDAVEEGFIRVSAGCEPTGELVGEVLRALDALG